MAGNIDTLNFSLSKSEVIRICDFNVAIINNVHGCILQLIHLFKILTNNAESIIVHYQYFSNIYYLILCDIYSNRLKLLSCIFFMISSLFIRLLIKIQIRNLKKSVSKSKYKSEI